MPEAPRPQTAQVFLSYSRSDREAAIAVRVALEQAGLSVFHDVESIREGDQWMKRLEDALAACSSFVVLVGRDGVRRWVGAEVQVAVNRHFGPQDDAERLPIYPVLLGDEGAPALPPFLSLFQAATWSAPDPVPETLLEAIKYRVSLLNPPEPFDGCPFLGLNAFRKKDAGLFFGRRQETLDALACLGSQQGTNPERLEGAGGTNYHRWLQIEGSSGAGKSSLVHAGMLPLIEQGALWARTGFDHWKILGPMMPGKDPLRKLAEVFELGLIEKREQRDILARAERLKRDPSALATDLIGFKQEQTAYLLIIDQFEELFTFADAGSRTQFDALLANALLDPACPLFVISTVRADFLDRYELLPCLQAAYNKVGNNYLLPTISERGLRDVIELPARLTGLDVSEVTAAILQDARGEIGALPLVENALFVLWNKRTGNRLGGDEFRAQNGIAGMLSAQADALLGRIEAQIPGGRRAALELLLRLTRINDEGRHTRQRIGRGEAVKVAGNGNDLHGEQIVQLLSGGAQGALDDQPGGALRLITAHTENDQRYVDLIHETLIRARGKDAKTGKPVGYWPTLFDYIDKNRDREILRQLTKAQTSIEAQRLQRKLAEQADKWRQSRWLARWWHRARSRDLNEYRRQNIPRSSHEDRFLIWSWRFARGHRAALALAAIALLGFLVQESYWAVGHGYPLAAYRVRWQYKLGMAVTLPRPVPVPGAGSTAGTPGKPSAESTSFTTPFYLAETEITSDQYEAFCEATGRDCPKLAAGRGNHPVAEVNARDAQAYAEWLGATTGKSCRLPTETEWEFAARAGTTSGYSVPRPHGSDDIFGKDLANCRDCGPRSPRGTTPVKSFEPNAWGLYDMHGNVWEWTCSAWSDEVDPSNQKCTRKDDTEARVLRGGSWNLDAAYARSDARSLLVPVYRVGDIGFRVLCSAPIE